MNAFGVACVLVFGPTVHTFGQSLSIDVGTHIISEGDSEAKIAISVLGSQDATDMIAVIQIGDRGPLVGGTAGPEITHVLAYTGSIW